MRQKIITILSIAMLSWIAAIALRSSPTVESVMNDFYSNKSRAEEELADPLILNAELVKLRVIEEIRNPDMPRRRYAIDFLGRAKVTEAFPVLLQILEDKNEKDYIRGDALESLCLLNPKQGFSLAKHYTSDTGYLGSIAKGLADGSNSPAEGKSVP